MKLDAQQLYTLAFSRPRDPRSPAYRAGVLAALRFRCHREPMLCPYRLGTAESDAWTAGTDEGHRRFREAQDAFAVTS